MKDRLGREITCLRISVTDRCNLRCVYCMAEEGVALLPREEVLSHEEIERVARAAASVGIVRLKLTGGEPLVREDLPALVRRLASIKDVEEVSLTTNGVLLARYAKALKAAGLSRLTVSLDSLDEERFRRITCGGELKDVLDGMEEARRAGLQPVKINVVVMRGINDDEVGEMARWAVKERLPVRFIEFMPRGEWREAPEDMVVRSEETMRRVGEVDRLVPAKRGAKDTGPVSTYMFERLGGSVGFISPVSEPFCPRCNRIRLTADGLLKPCLLGEKEVSVKGLLRGGASDEEIVKAIRETVEAKPTRHPARRTFPMSKVGG